MTLLADAIKTVSFREIRDFVAKKKGAASVKMILTELAPRFDIDLGDKSQYNLLYRRVHRLLNAGVETDEIQKNGTKFVVLSPEEAEAHRKALVKQAKQRATVAEGIAKLKLKGAVIGLDGMVSIPFAEFLRLAK